MAQTKSFTKEELQTVIDQMDFMKDSPYVAAAFYVVFLVNLTILKHLSKK